MPADDVSRLSVRPMELGEVGLRIDYFHSATDEELSRMGVARSRLMDADTWRRWFEVDHARPLDRREGYAVVWEVDGEVVGYSSVDRIEFGEQAFLHLHVFDPARRRQGLGAPLVRLSAAHVVEVLRLQRICSEPNAYNRAPNRTLQRAGFRYLFTHHTAPAPINYRQPVTRWVLDAADL